MRLELCYEAHSGMGLEIELGGPCQGTRLPLAFCSFSQKSVSSVRKDDLECFMH